MKLLECYIENFGTLHDFRYSFTDGLNVFNHDNGFGKTTLSVFIKAMFYGLDDTKKQKLEENDRKHYLPWQGGVFGGWLTFTTGTLSYKVERTFGAKASDDTYTLYELETGKVSLAYQGGLGEKIFGIDADGFERTVFLSERRLSQKSDNKSVSAKLSDLVGCDFDLGELDNALSMLEDRRKYYYKKGGSGKIGDIKNEIAALDLEIGRITRISDTLPEREASLADYQSKINEGQTVLNEYSVRIGHAKAEVEYIKRAKALEEINSELEDVRKFFSDGIPSENEIANAEAAYSEAQMLKETLDDGAEEEKRKDDLKERISEADGIISKMSRAEQARPTPAMHIPAIIVSALLLACGLAVCLLASVPAGIACIAVGVIGMIASIPLYQRYKGNAERTASIFGEAKRFLDRNGKGYASTDSYMKELYGTKAELTTELALISARARGSAEKKIRLEALEKRYTEFLSGFDLNSNDPFTEIRSKCTQYKRLSWKLEDDDRALKSFIRVNGINPEAVKDNSDGMNAILATDPEELKASLASLNRERTLLEREYREALEEVNRLDEYLAKREDLHDKLRAAEEKHKIINLTRDHLNLAKDSLTTKYLGKTREAFKKYVSIMTGEAPELFSLSVDFGISRSIGSVSKPEEAWSLGTRETYAIAAKLALADSLYDVDSPFIILDDPFAHLDDKRYAMAAKIIKKLAESRQIIYLTCSRSRAI